MFKRLLRLFTSPVFHQSAGESLHRKGSIVIAYHPRLCEIGEAILDDGGNAFDAFVAVAAAQNVMAEGASSLAGPLAVLLFDRSSGRVRYLDADFNDPLDPAWRSDPRLPRDGRVVLVPGAPAGLEALAREHGTRPFAYLLQPAIQLAADGFPASRLMSSLIAWRSRILKRSEHGRKTYFTSGGRPLQPGQLIRQPDVATFLWHLATEGSSYVYRGDWGRQFLQLVQSKNGILTQEDLAVYRVHWEEPWNTSYRGHTLFSCSGRTYGGLWALLALKTLEHFALPTSSHYSTNADALGLLVRLARRIWSEAWIMDPRALDDRGLVESRLSSRYTRAIWEDISADLDSLHVPTAKTHSYQIIVADKEGNVANGTTTIEADPWGEGLFVQGIPLTTAGQIPLSTAQGQRRISPFSIHFAFRDKQLAFALGAISNSLVEAAFQFLVNLIDYRLPLESVVDAPRFGTFPGRKKVNLSKNWLDPRISEDVVRSLERRYLKFKRSGVIDTGCGAILSMEAGGELRGIVAPLPYIVRPFGTEP